MRLKDKVAIITGGSRGIGFATADKQLLELVQIWQAWCLSERLLKRQGGHSLNFFHGEYFGTAKWGCLSGIEVCSKRIDCIIIICHGNICT